MNEAVQLVGMEWVGVLKTVNEAVRGSHPLHLSILLIVIHEMLWCFSDKSLTISCVNHSEISFSLPRLLYHSGMGGYATVARHHSRMRRRHRHYHVHSRSHPRHHRRHSSASSIMSTSHVPYVARYGALSDRGRIAALFSPLSVQWVEWSLSYHRARSRAPIGIISSSSTGHHGDVCISSSDREHEEGVEISSSLADFTLPVLSIPTSIIPWCQPGLYPTTASTNTTAITTATSNLHHGSFGVSHATTGLSFLRFCDMSLSEAASIASPSLFPSTAVHCFTSPLRFTSTTGGGGRQAVGGMLSLLSAQITHPSSVNHFTDRWNSLGLGDVCTSLQHPLTVDMSLDVAECWLVRWVSFLHYRWRVTRLAARVSK